MSHTIARERRSWTAKEDQLLREAVQKEDPDNANPSKWHAIAKHVPNRTNKDCRKRWFAKMASDVVKGGWSPQEDEKLVKGIERYGTRWSLVASVVQSRNSDQCAKRWTDTLNPAIDRTTWTSDADELLLQAVAEHGKVWTKIVKTYFPGRTGLSAKNRYNSITRFHSDASRAGRMRRKSVDVPSSLARKAESASSSSSVSPAPTHVSLPFASSSFNHPADVKTQYQMGSYSWSSSVSADEIPSLRPSSMAVDYPQHSASRSSPSNENGYHSHGSSTKLQLSSFKFPSPLNVYNDSMSSYSHSNQSYRHHFANHDPGSSHDFQNFSSSQVPLMNVHAYGDVTNQFLFDGQTMDAGSSMNMNWDSSLSSTPDSKPLIRSSLPHAYSYV